MIDEATEAATWKVLEPFIRTLVEQRTPPRGGRGTPRGRDIGFPRYHAYLRQAVREIDRLSAALNERPAARRRAAP